MGSIRPETQLLEQTASVLGVSLGQLVRAGTLVYAKREFLNNKKVSAAAGGESEAALLRSGSGVAGVADARIRAAYDSLAEAQAPITPAKLATRALTGYPTALRWLKIHHPELLAPRPLPASPSPEQSPKPEAKPEPKASQEKPPQKPSQEKRSRPTAKARKAPKRATSSPKEQPKPPEPESEARKAAATPFEPISIVPFREFSLPGSHRVTLAWGALDIRGAVYFSAEPFGQGVLDEAIRASNLRNAAQHVNLIAYQDHHLVPVSWLMIQVPRHQPFLKRAQNHIRKESRPKPAPKRVRDPEVEPF